MAATNASDFKSVNIDSCVTEREKVQLDFKWTIKEFFDLPQKTGEYLESTVFPSVKHQTTYWKLRLYPKGETKQFKNSVCLYLYLMTAYCSKVTANNTLVFEDTGGDTIVEPESKLRVFSEASDNWGFFKYVKRDKLSESLQKSKSNTLIIYTSIAITTDFCNKPGPSSHKSSESFLDACLSKDFQKLLLDDCYSDFVINIDNRKFKVHKCILHTRSSVFAAMFTSKMEETKSSEVSLEDVDPDAFEKVLQFVYTGSLAMTNTEALDILPVADRYNIVSLKEQCAEILTKNICTENAVKTLVIADSHSLQDLKQSAIRYICQNGDVISKSDDWSLIASNYPTLASELFLALCHQRSEVNAWDNA